LVFVRIGLTKGSDMEDTQTGETGDMGAEGEEGVKGAEAVDGGLSRRQEIAVRELVRGKGVVAVARRVGVNRVTLYRWMQEPEFVAGMNRWRASVTEAARGRMFSLLDDAAEMLEGAVCGGNAFLAMTVLDKMGALRPAEVREEKPEDVDAEMMSRRRELEQRADRVALDRMEVDLTAAEAMNEALRNVHTSGRLASGESPASWNPWSEEAAAGAPAQAEKIETAPPWPDADGTAGAERTEEPRAAGAIEPGKETQPPEVRDSDGRTAAERDLIIDMLASSGLALDGTRIDPITRLPLTPEELAAIARDADPSSQGPLSESDYKTPDTPATPAPRVVSERPWRPGDYEGMRGHGKPYAPGMPQPYDHWDDVFNDIIRINR
jgi:hypothetical protein